MSMPVAAQFVPGLEGVVAAQTRLSLVDGEKGELVIAGYPLAELAENATFEEVVYLLWNDALPRHAERAAFARLLAGHRALPAPTLALLRELAASRLPVIDALRIAAGTLSLETEGVGEANKQLLEARVAVAAFPTIVAAYWRLLNRLEPLEPDPALGHAASFLKTLTGQPPSDARVRGLETYWNTVIDHGLNASTFTARVIVSTRSDLISAVTGAVGALKGPLHGGAPGPALDMVFEIGQASKAESVIRAKLERGERLMGFGHRIYKVRDPRADVLSAAAERLYHADGDLALFNLAREVERTALRLLEEYKPGHRLQTNVEFYTALLLHGLEIPTELFTPTFAIGRVVGWTAHCLEQLAENRLIRPQSDYVGPKDRRWVPVEKRG